MKKIVIIRGVPGAGKTTLATKLEGEMNGRGISCIHHEADQYFAEDPRRYLPSKAGDAYEWVIGKTRESIHDFDVVIVSSMNIHAYEVYKYVAIADENRAENIVFHLVSDYGNVHGVKPAVIKSLKSDFEPYEGEHIISDPEAEYDSIVSMIIEGFTPREELPPEASSPEASSPETASPETEQDTPVEQDDNK